MELTKFHSGEILAHIRHDLRQIPEGKSYGNESVDKDLSTKNYSLIDRGKTAEAVNQYRKDFEKECFKYNRKNLVHSVELVIQCPADCPPEQHREFFQTSFDWYCNNYLPAGKDCVFVAEVHADEHKYIKVFENGREVEKDISKEHLHIMYVPAVPAGEKHPNYEYRLNADQLTKRGVLREMHPSLQKELDRKGIQATVYSKKNGSGKTIGLSVAQLKEITDKYGITIDHPITVDELAQIMSKNIDLTQKVDVLSSTVNEQKQGIHNLTINAAEKDRQIESLKSEIRTKSAEIKTDKEKEELKARLQEKEIENQKLKAAARQIISEKEIKINAATETIISKDQELTLVSKQNTKLQEQLRSTQELLKDKDIELQQSKAKLAEIEKEKEAVREREQERTWGADSGWGTASGWGKTTGKTHTVEEEKIW